MVRRSAIAHTASTTPAISRFVRASKMTGASSRSEVCALRSAEDCRAFFRGTRFSSADEGFF